MPDIGELIKREKLREQIAQFEAEERRAQEQDLAQNPVTATEVAQSLKSAALPLLGQTAGTIAGMATGPVAPLAVPALEAAGGMGGEALNQLFGITPPSTEAVALQGILPVAMRGASAVAKVIPSATKGARFLNEIAPVEATNRLATLKASVPETSKAFFAKADASGARIPTLQTQKVIKSELDGRLVGGSADNVYRGTREYLENLGATLKRKQGALKPSDYQRELRDLRSIMGKATTDVEKSSLQTVKGELERALEAAPAGSDLAKARKLFAREKVFDDLDELSFKAEKARQGKGGLEQFNASEVLRKIEKDPKFSKRFQAALSPKEQTQIKKIYTLLNEIPPLPSDAGVLGRLGGDVSQGLKFGAASHLVGADPAVSTGMALAGSMLRPALDTAKVFKLAMSTEEGRRVLLKELTAQKNKPLKEIMQKVAVGISATEPAQETTREAFGTTGPISPFPNIQ